MLVYIINNTGVIFQERNFGSRCWTHDLEELVKLARLEVDLDADMKANPQLGVNWTKIKDWTEASRYEQATQIEAEQIVMAIADPSDGMLQWIRKRW